MTFNEAKNLAERRLSRAKNPGVLVAYKDLGDRYIFFAAKDGCADGPLGTTVIEVYKSGTTAKWQSVFNIGREFLVNETRDIPEE